MNKNSAVVLKSVSQLDMKFVFVPDAPFIMGSDESGEWAFCAMDYEKPLSRIQLRDYWIGKYPVTNAQYLKFLESSNYQPRDHYPSDKYEHCDKDKLIKHIKSDGSNHPVRRVSWYDAIGYCEWASNMTGLKIRLPTEAEWEKAARGTNGLVFPWGDFDPGRNIKNYANTNSSDSDDTTPVGKYSPAGDSPYGCSDMIGNVAEWTSTLFSKYPYSPFDGREEFKEYEVSTYRGILPDHRQDKRVVRGGAYNKTGTISMRCAWRGYNHSGYRIENVGFRVVCESL